MANWIKVAGLVCSLAGAGLAIATDYVNDKKLDELVDEKVNEALANRENEETTEE